MDLPVDVGLPPSEVAPVAAEERSVASPEDRDQPWNSLAITGDVRPLGGGGTVYVAASGVMQGEPPPPWDLPVGQADRLVGGDRAGESPAWFESLGGDERPPK